MDKTNALAFTAARHAESLQTAAAAGAAAGPPAGDHSGLLSPPPIGPLPSLVPPSAPAPPPGITSVPLDPLQPPPHQHHHHQQLRSQPSTSSYPTPPLSYNAVAPPSVGGSHAWQSPQKESSWRGSFDYGKGPPPPPLMGNPHAAANGNAPHPAWLPPAGPSPISSSPVPSAGAAQQTAPEAGGGQAPSLTDAFSAFLMQPDEPKPATANSLAEPAAGPASGGKSRLGGLFGTAKTLAKYVAGNEQQKQQGHAGTGQPASNGTAH